MAATRATSALDAAGVPYRLHNYEAHVSDDADLTYGEAVAVEIGADPDAVFKTLIASVDGELVVAVVPVSGLLNLKALAKALGGKRAEMANADDAQRTTGYVVGGISPFGQKKALRRAVDETVEVFDTVFVSAGQRGLQLQIAPAALTDTAIVAPITKM